MNQPQRVLLNAIAPIRRTRAGWNQALLAAAGSNHRLLIDLESASRLDCGLFASLALVEQELMRRGGSLRLHATAPVQRTLVALAGLQRLLSSEGGGLLDLSCAAAFGDEDLTLTVQHDLGLNPRLSLPASHSWISRLALRRATIDLGELGHVNSIIVAWLLQLAQSAKPAELVLTNVNPQVMIQFNQLRLNHLLQVQPRVGA